MKQANDNEAARPTVADLLVQLEAYCKEQELGASDARPAGLKNQQTNNYLTRGRERNRNGRGRRFFG